MNKNSELVFDNFTIYLDSKLGSGTQGSVYLASKNTDMNKYAAKIIPKTDMSKKEFELLRLLSYDSFNIVEFYDCFEYQESLVIIMEYCDRNFADLVSKNGGSLKEQLLQYYAIQIIDGIKESHKKGITHRDVKLENIFLKENRIKIGDFGFATNENNFTNIIGTPNYMSPELLRGWKSKIENSMYGSDYKLDKNVDLWALGILLYRVAYGRFPFQFKNTSTFSSVIQQCLEFWDSVSPSILFNSPDNKISDKLKSLLQGMLDKNIKNRFSMNEILAHPWVNEGKLTYHTELGSLQSYYNNIYSGFPSQMIKSSIDRNIRKSRDMVETYFLVKTFLEKKRKKFMYFEEIITQARSLLNQFTLSWASPKFTEYKDKVQMFAIFYMLILQKQLSFIIGHQKYFKDTLLLSLKIGRQEENIKMLFNQICKAEFQDMYSDVQTLIDKSVKNYNNLLPYIKSKIGFKLGLSEWKAINIDFGKFDRIKENYSDYFEKTIKTMISFEFIHIFSSIEVQIKNFIVYIHKYETNKGKKTIEDLLVEIETLSEAKQNEYFQDLETLTKASIKSSTIQPQGSKLILPGLIALMVLVIAIYFAMR